MAMRYRTAIHPNLDPQIEGVLSWVLIDSAEGISAGPFPVYTQTLNISFSVQARAIEFVEGLKKLLSLTGTVSAFLVRVEHGKIAEIQYAHRLRRPCAGWVAPVYGQ